MIHYAQVLNNEIILCNENLYKQNLKKLNGKEIQIDIKLKEKNQTIAQRNYFHLILSLFCEYTGDNESDLKKSIKKHFGTITEYIDPIDNIIHKDIKSTAEYTRLEYINLINNFIKFIQESYPDFTIPLPQTYKLNPDDYVITNTFRNS